MQVKNSRIEEIFAGADALISGTHVVYTSGRHGASYVNKDALYVHTSAISELCRFMADEFNADEIDVVAGPTVGGVVLSQWVASHLNAKRSAGETLSIYAEEEDGADGQKKRIFKRGYDQLIAGKTVLVVEDVLTTGGSARKVVEAVRAAGGNVKAVTVLCNRGGVTSEIIGSVPLLALTAVSMESWEEQDCPLCKDNVPINTRVGKGKAYLASRALP